MRSRSIAAPIIALSAVAGFAFSADSPPAAPLAASTAPVDAVETYFRAPSYSQVTLSPDGKSLAAVVPLNGRRNLALIDLDKHSAVALTTLTKYDVSSYQWLGNRLLEVKTANLADASGLIQTQQDVLIDLEGNVVRNMATVSKRRFAEVLASLDDTGEHLVIETVDRNLKSPDAYSFNPYTGERRLLTFRSPGDVSGFVVDHAGQVRVATSMRNGGKRQTLSYRRTNEDEWTTLRDDAAEDAPITPIGFDFDDKLLYVYARNAEQSGRDDIYLFDPEANKLVERVHAAQGGRDAGRLVVDRPAKKVVGFGVPSRDGVEWIDPAWARLQKSIDAVLPDTRNTIRWAANDTDKLLIVAQSPTQLPIIYFLEHKTLKMEEVAIAYPWIKPEMLSPRTFVRYKARDGLSIPAFLTMPTHPDGTKPPLIVEIHGGPFVGPHNAGYDAEAQFFASRGYAVLQPDFRGTSGYGDAFARAGWKQWGLAMQDDLTDGVRWLIDTGKVDGDRVCLIGGSYGGYATLWGLEKEPQMFRCGVAYVAVSDLEMLFDVSWSDTMRLDLDNRNTNYLQRTVGDPDRDREKLREVSPLFHADRLQAPLLLAYGAADERVPLVHGNRMRSALDRNNKPYEWVVYTDEGHGFTKDSDKYDFYRRVEAFFAKNLAPRTAAAGGSPTSAPSRP